MTKIFANCAPVSAKTKNGDSGRSCHGFAVPKRRSVTVNRDLLQCKSPEQFELCRSNGVVLIDIAFYMKNMVNVFLKGVIVRDHKQLIEMLDLADLLCKTFPSFSIHICRRFV